MYIRKGRPDVSRLGARAELAALALAGAALRGRLRRPRVAARSAPLPASPETPTKRVFETTATSFDGTPVRVTATAAPGNHAPAVHVRPANDPGPGSLSIAEGSGHPAEQRGRPITWIVVAFISTAFVAAGLGLVYATAWLFIAGLVAVVVGGLAGWAFDIMGDRGVGGSITQQRSAVESNERSARRR